jgi:hypothetical protein
MSTRRSDKTFSDDVIRRVIAMPPQPKPKNDARASPKKRGDDLGAVTGTSLDKGMELDALAKLPKDERKELIDRAKAGETVTGAQRTKDRRRAAL